MYPKPTPALNRVLVTLSFLTLTFTGYARAQQYTRGIGVYLGDPKEFFGPSMKIDAIHYRNLALNRAVYQSSSYDYNLTGQLVTDGIVSTSLPGWLVVSTNSQSTLPRDGREHVLDRHGSSQQQLQGATVWIQVQMAGSYMAPPVDSITLEGAVGVDTLTIKPWKISISGSNDGVKWDELGSAKGDTLIGTDALSSFMKRFSQPGQKMTAQQRVFMRRFAARNRRVLSYGFKLPAEVLYKYYRFDGDDPGATKGDLAGTVVVEQLL